MTMNIFLSIFAKQVRVALEQSSRGLTLRSSASGSGCPSASSLCLISSSSSFSRFRSRSSSSTSFSLSRRRFWRALPLQAKQRNRNRLGHIQISSLIRWSVAYCTQKCHEINLILHLWESDCLKKRLCLQVPRLPQWDIYCFEAQPSVTWTFFYSVCS